MGIKVSVIVPVYQTEQYLEKCLDSLVQQTLKDIEIVVVNDGSPDNSQKMIDRYQEQYPQVRSIQKENGGLNIYNLGSGKGFSVLEIINTFNKVCPKQVKYEIVERRAGDVDVCYSSAEKAEKELGWKATRTLEDMCLSSFLFGEKNIED